VFLLFRLVEALLIGFDLLAQLAQPLLGGDTVVGDLRPTRHDEEYPEEEDAGENPNR
jgi:hypothetical protein